MQGIRVFMSFDRERDRDLHERLIRDCRGSGSPFDVTDWSGRDSGRPQSSGPDESLRARIAEVDAVVVICGEHTDSAIGVSVELRMAQDERKPYLLIWGRRELTCTMPLGAKPDDSMYTWIGSILAFQIGSEMRKLAARENAA